MAAVIIIIIVVGGQSWGNKGSEAGALHVGEVPGAEVQADSQRWIWRTLATGHILNLHLQGAMLLCSQPDS